jgi:pantetheine-phosphate adenylyltransferase
MTSLAVVPGSFDPVTLGHLDVVERARHIFDEVHVVVVHNPSKTAMLPVARRVELIEESLRDAGLSDRVTVTSWSVGLLVDYCREVGATALVKGIRSEVDVAYETPMAIVNRDLANVETVFLLPNPAHSHVSSSLVQAGCGARRGCITLSSRRRDAVYEDGRLQLNREYPEKVKNLPANPFAINVFDVSHRIGEERVVSLQ